MNNLLRHLKFRKIGSESSRQIYCTALYVLCKYASRFPDELLTLQKDEIEKLVENFCYHKMENEWKSPKTANTFLFMTKTFFKVNGFKGNQKLEIEGFHQSARERTKPEYIPTLEEARRMANVGGSLRNRAIILLMMSTGLRNGTLRALLYSDVKDELEKGQTNILIKVHKGMKRVVFSACKGNIEYCVFTSTEATEALKLYINDRRRFGELEDGEVLFHSEHNRLPRKERINKPLTPRELQVIVKNAARKAGIREWKNVVPHCLRKTFESVLRSQFADGGRLDLKTQEYFMGHILGGCMDTYFDKTKTDELRREYAKLNFKPEKQVSIEVLDSLRGMAKVLGIDLARLEESRIMERGMDLDDSEKLVIAQQAIKRAVTEFKKAIESNAKTMLLTGSSEELIGAHCTPEKTLIGSAENRMTHNVSSQDSSSRPASIAICPSIKPTCSPQKKVRVPSSMQFDLDMSPQEHSVDSRLQTQTHEVRSRSLADARKKEEMERTF